MRSPETIKQLKEIGYWSWIDMRKRCNNKKCLSYKDYGGRGIKVCEQWNSFQAFLADMGPRPFGWTIDRIDVNGNYEPSNCRWVPKAHQNKNTRKNIYFEIDGETLCLADACRKLGMPYSTVVSRISSLKWDKYKAIYTPLLRQGRKISRKNIVANLIETPKETP